MIGQIVGQPTDGRLSKKLRTRSVLETVAQKVERGTFNSEELVRFQSVSLQHSLLLSANQSHNRYHMSSPPTMFKVISSIYTSTMAKEVSQHLVEGWRLHGEMNAVRKECWGHFKKMGEEVVYSQAVCK